MQITLRDFLGRDNYRFSPYVWRTKPALAHKKLVSIILEIVSKFIGAPRRASFTVKYFPTGTCGGLEALAHDRR